MAQAPLWTAEEAAAATGGAGPGGWTAAGVSIDSRALAPGDLFVALRDARDGHEFVADALGRGAAAALVDRAPERVAPGAPLLTVGNALDGLRALAAAARARLGAAARVIGVTGSVGKTGTKEMLRAMLATQGPVHAAERSFNNHWGVPLTLARMPAEARWAAVEMGMNHAGEIRPLSTLARPHAAIVTTVEAVHIENFDDELGIADAKAEIVEGLEPGGAAILNRDNRWFDRVSAAAAAHGARVLSFGADERAEARLLSVDLSAGWTMARARIGGREIAFKIAAPGRHLAMNALAALAAVEACGGDVARAAMGLSDWRPPEGRGRRWRVALGPEGMDGAILVIDESYNANPASVGAALEALASASVEHDVGRVRRGRRIACLGDMLELGAGEAAMHAGLAAHPAMERVDLVFCVGERMRALDAALPPARRGGWFADAASAAGSLRRRIDAGDAVSVKGSNAMGMGRIVEALKAAGAARPADGADGER